MLIRLAGLLLLLVIAGTAGAGHPLEPIDTSSPRATFQSFLAVTEEAGRLYTEYRDAPSPATQNAFLQIEDKAVRLLDLSQVPPAVWSEAGFATFLLLWEVTARIELPGLDEIPEAAGDEVGEPPRSWRLPGTEVTIAVVEEGPRAGEFLFSPDTVKRAQDFYELVRELPYVRPVPTKNLSRTEQLITGWMIPLAWVEALPDWANTVVLGQVLWKWMAMFMLLGLALSVLILVFLWTRRKSWDGSWRSYLRHLGTPVVILLIAPMLRSLAGDQINVTGSAAHMPDYIVEVAEGVALVWVVWLTANWIGLSIIASPRIDARSLEANLIRLAARFVGILATLVLVFRLVNDLGVPVYGLVAGAGVGGVAIALAAKNTLENFMGTLNLFADRPLGIGDLCSYDEDSTPGWRPVGRVESIGLRSTKIRRFDRTLVTIPNADFAQRHIVNLSICDRMLLSTTLGLRYETSDDQLRFLLAELRELLHAHPKTIHTVDDPVRVRFVEYGDYSLNVAIRVYIRATDYNEFLAIQEDILLRIMKLVGQAGTGFAFPSQTLYLGRDGGLDKERQDGAEKQVREWSSAHTLPFPDIAEDQRRKITDTLDYPPEGSPGAEES
ncbi:MAG: mechanosensitive ion channel family protein [Thiogranum sp.]